MKIRVPDGVDLEAAAREVHRMWHQGATEAEMTERLAIRLSAGAYREMGGLMRRLCRRWAAAVLPGIIGPGHCGAQLPEDWTVICDEPQPPGPV